MKIEVISMWYNEEFLAPLFLQHYAFADQITIILDSDTTDGTKQILEKDPRVRIVSVTSNDMMNDHFKPHRINEQYKASQADWILSVDADEFVFPLSHDYDLRKYLEERLQSSDNIVEATLCAVFRHQTETDIDRTKPPVFQRRHGIREGVADWYQPYSYYKPLLAKAGAHQGWGVGNHTVGLYYHSRISKDRIFGTHWYHADVCFAVERQLKNRRDRQGKTNYTYGLTAPRYVNKTEKGLIEEAQRHSNDPQLF